MLQEMNDLNFEPRVADYCSIREGKIVHNGKTIFEQEGDGFSIFAKSAYKALGMAYAKFFKMDDLSKLALLASESLLKQEAEKNTALVFSNRAASLDTDRKHQETMGDYPSPAVFVYTLPNICLGEISIKHQLHSENAFFISERFDPKTLIDYTDVLLQTKNAEKVLCGWVDMDNGKYDAFLYVVAKSGTFVHSVEVLNSLYHTHE